MGVDVAQQDVDCARGMIINPGSDRPQGPWDPDAKKKWIDTRYFWVLLPFLLLIVGVMVLASLLGS